MITLTTKSLGAIMRFYPRTFLALATLILCQACVTNDNAQTAGSSTPTKQLPQGITIGIADQTGKALISTTANISDGTCYTDPTTGAVPDVGAYQPIIFQVPLTATTLIAQIVARDDIQLRGASMSITGGVNNPAPSPINWTATDYETTYSNVRTFAMVGNSVIVDPSSLPPLNYLPVRVTGTYVSHEAATQTSYVTCSPLPIYLVPSTFAPEETTDASVMATASHSGTPSQTYQCGNASDPPDFGVTVTGLEPVPPASSNAHYAVMVSAPNNPDQSTFVYATNNVTPLFSARFGYGNRVYDDQIGKPAPPGWVPQVLLFSFPAATFPKGTMVKIWAINPDGFPTNPANYVWGQIVEGSGSGSSNTLVGSCNW